MLGYVKSFPEPDDKVRTSRAIMSGGGNAGNTSTAIARLGAPVALATCLGHDPNGDTLMAELQAENVNTDFVVRRPGSSSFAYIIVDTTANTRTCIHTPGTCGELVPADVMLCGAAALFSADERDANPPPVPQLNFPADDAPGSSDGDDGAFPWPGSSTPSGGCGGGAPPLPAPGPLPSRSMRLLHCDARATKAAACAAKEANKRGVPVSVDAEKPRLGLEDELLPCGDIIFTNSTFPFRVSNAEPPQTPSGEEPSYEAVAAAQVANIFGRYPRARLVISTLGERGAVASVRRGADLSGIASGALAEDLSVTEAKGEARACDLEDMDSDYDGGDGDSASTVRQSARQKLENGVITQEEFSKILEQSDEVLAAEEIAARGSAGSDLIADDDPAAAVPIKFQRLPSSWRRVVAAEPLPSNAAKPGSSMEGTTVRQRKPRLQFYDSMSVSAWPVEDTTGSGASQSSSPALPAVVVDTTGAGDAFIGGTLVGLTRGFKLEGALALGVFVASHKLRAHGARAGLPRVRAGEVPSCVLPAGSGSADDGAEVSVVLSTSRATSSHASSGNGNNKSAGSGMES